MYYNVPSSKLIFLTNSEHIKLHMNNLSETTHEKMCVANKGKNNPNYGKHASTETLSKMSVSHSGMKHHMFGKHHSVQTKEKLSIAAKGRKWYNNGKEEFLLRECPKGFVKGRIRS